ncbi:unnamed protein product [Boreogadus saida]
MSDVMMRADQGPVLWSGHMGLQVGGQRSEPVLWSGHMGLRGGGQRSEPVLWSGHMGLRVGGQRSEPVLWSGQGPRGTKREQGPVGAGREGGGPPLPSLKDKGREFPHNNLTGSGPCSLLVPWGPDPDQRTALTSDLPPGAPCDPTKDGL